MAVECPFQLLLHPVHGSSNPVPFVLDELALASSAEDRLSALAKAAAASAQQLGAYPRDATPVELVLDHTLLRARDPCGGGGFVLPIMFSQLGFSARSSLYDAPTSTWTAGVIALGLPLAGELAETASNEYSRPCNLWLLVVTRRLDVSASVDINGFQASDVTMREAVTAFVRSGAICDTFCGVPFPDVARTGAPLGEGSSADVRLMWTRSPTAGDEQPVDSAYAVKLWNASHFDQDSNVLNEIRHLIRAQGHPNIGNFVGFFRSRLSDGRPRWLMIMEAYQLGDLQAFVSERGALPELDAVTFAIGILRALVHIHALEIIHRDVKLENVLLKQDGDVVLVDFGIAVHTAETDERMRVRGTAGFFAPETLLGMGSVKKSDVFGCGTVLYGLLGGVSPFLRRDHDSTLRANCRARVAFPEDRFGNVSEDARQLLRKMLQRRFQQRLPSREALRRSLVQKARLDIPSPGVPDDVPRDTANLATPSMESRSASAEADPTDPSEALVPDAIHDAESSGDEVEYLEIQICDAEVASMTEVPSSVLYEGTESGDDFERSFDSKDTTLTSRLASISSKALTCARRKLDLRRSLRKQHTRAAHAVEEDQVMQGAGRESGVGASTKDQVMQRGGRDFAVGASTKDQVMQGAGRGSAVGARTKDQVMQGAGRGSAVGASTKDQVMQGAGRGSAVGASTKDQVMQREGRDSTVGASTKDQVMQGAGRGSAVGAIIKDQAMQGAGRGSAVGASKKDQVMQRAGRDSAVGASTKDQVMQREDRDAAAGASIPAVRGSGDGPLTDVDATQQSRVRQRGMLQSLRRACSKCSLPRPLIPTVNFSSF